MENFNLHILDYNIWFYHDNLAKLVDSVTEEEKRYLEDFCKEIGNIFGSEIKLFWGIKYGGKSNEKVLSHIANNRHDLDLIEPEYMEKGYLKYMGHNLTGDMAKAPIFSIAVSYISLLNKQAVKIKNLK